jgi:hypothetical protein
MKTKIWRFEIEINYIGSWWYECVKCMKQGYKLKAIVIYKDNKKCTLREAKKYIDNCFSKYYTAQQHLTTG